MAWLGLAIVYTCHVIITNILKSFSSFIFLATWNEMFMKTLVLYIFKCIVNTI